MVRVESKHRAGPERKEKKQHLSSHSHVSPNPTPPRSHPLSLSIRLSSDSRPSARPRPQMDPPSFCSEDGTPTSIEELNRRTERSIVDRIPGSAIKSWRWKEGSRWRASDWQFAIAFQSTFKVLKDRTCMVRRRMWFRTRVAIARNLVASGSRAVPPPTPTSADLAAAGPAAAAIAEPENGDEVGRPGAVVRFSRGTVYNRELDNRRWRASAASRAAPHWTKQYFGDCAACEISPARAVAAFLAVDGVSVYERQAQARLLLAGKVEWPPMSALLSVLQYADALTAVGLELQEQLIRDISELGQAEAIPTAEQHLVFATANVQARDGDPGVTHSHLGGDAAAADAAPIPAGSGVPDDKLEGFIAQTLTRLKLEAEPADGDLGYDTSDGWFVLDEDLAESRVGASASDDYDDDLPMNGTPAQWDAAGGAVGPIGGVRRPRDRGLEVDDSMYQSAHELDASVLSTSDTENDGGDGGNSDGDGGNLLELSSVYFDSESGPAVPHGAVGVSSPPTAAQKTTNPAAKAQIQAEIKLLEEIMRRNRES
eukprot:m.219891 g.219891  ORF g.219891 m.219891 type:complete len:541 (+) comp25766_c0_seq3:961-2583(+)